MVTLAVACWPFPSATVATYLVVLLSGNVAEPVGKVSCRSSASGSAGAKLMVVAFLVVQVRVVSWPATTVRGLTASETVGAGAGGLGGTGGGLGGTGGGLGGVGEGVGGGNGVCGFPPFPVELVCGASVELAPPHPAKKAIAKMVERTRRD